MLMPRGPDPEMHPPRGEHIRSHGEPAVLPEVCYMPLLGPMLAYFHSAWCASTAAVSGLTALLPAASSPVGRPWRDPATCTSSHRCTPDAGSRGRPYRPAAPILPPSTSLAPHQ